MVLARWRIDVCLPGTCPVVAPPVQPPPAQFAKPSAYYDFGFLRNAIFRIQNEIIDVIIMYLNADHESSGHTITWATILLQEHPEAFQKAKEESERVVKNKPPTQQVLSLKEVREMDYLSRILIKPSVKEKTRPLDTKLHIDTRALEQVDFDYQANYGRRAFRFKC